MKKINLLLFFVLGISLLPMNVYSKTFEEWKLNFSDYALKQGVSQETLNNLNVRIKVLIQIQSFHQQFYVDHLST